MIEPLAEGPLDPVSLAFGGDQGLEILCVVHRLPRHLAEDVDLLTRFREHANLARRLSHGNLVTTHVVGQVDREPFIAQEFVQGHDLGDVVARCAAEHVRFPVEVALYVVSQLARGLAYAHDFDGLELIHQDINPFKIRLSYSGEVKLLGFGLTGALPDPSHAAAAAASGEADAASDAASNAASAAASKNRRGERSAYQAPEVRSGGPVDHRADLYSLGVVLWELLTQRRFVASENPDGAPVGGPTLPVALDKIVSKLLAFSPDRRFQSGDELRAAIDECLPSTLNAERRLRDLLARLYDVRHERERLRELVNAGGAVRVRRSTGQNPLLPGRRAGEDRSDARTPPPALVIPPVAAPDTPAPLDADAAPVAFRSRAERYRLRVVASAAFAVLTFVTMVAVVIALRYASERAAVADEAAAAAAAAAAAQTAAQTVPQTASQSAPLHTTDPHGAIDEISRPR